MFFGEIGRTQTNSCLPVGVPPVETGTDLVEYAGRLCYQSTDKMWKNPDFIAARVREGHTDIMEHNRAWMMVGVTPDQMVEIFRENDAGVAVTELRMYNQILSCNLRTKILTRSAVLSMLAEKMFSDNTKTKRFSIEPLDHTALLAITPLPNLPADISKLHASATFLIHDISRTASHQLVRHRKGSFSQESQRYVEGVKSRDEFMSKFVVPPAIAGDEKLRDIFQGQIENAVYAYEEMRLSGVRKEDARFIIPSAAKTKMVVTMQLRWWEHFVQQRAAKAAQWEIRNVASEVKQLLEKAFPMLEGKWKWESEY